MIYISKKTKKESETKVTLKEFISLANGIYRTPNIQESRVIEADRICKNEIFLDYYYSYIEKYSSIIDSGFSKKCTISENNTVFKIIEMLADNILYTEDAKNENKKSKASKTRPIQDARNNRESKFDDFNMLDDDGKPLPTNDKMDRLSHNNQVDPRNPYCWAKIDLKEKHKHYYDDSDFSTSITIYSSSDDTQGVKYTSNMLSDYKSFKDHISSSSDYRENKRLSKQKSKITQDQMDLINIIKRPFGVKHRG